MQPCQKSCDAVQDIELENHISKNLGQWYHLFL